MTSEPTELNTGNAQPLIRFDELPEGKPRRVNAGSDCILLCRVADSVYAVDELCTHEDISLSLGVLCDYRLRCPLHGSQFDIRTGQVLDEPADEDLQTHDVIIKDGWVCLADSSRLNPVQP